VNRLHKQGKGTIRVPVLVEEALQIVIPETCRIGIIILTSAEKWDKENQREVG